MSTRKSEAALQIDVVATCKAMALLCYHTYDSRRSEPGFPDLVIVGARGVLYRELKSERGRVSPEQVFWGQALTDAGQDFAVWRPSDWPDRIVAELRAIGRVTRERPLPSQAELRRRIQRRGRRAT